MIPVWTHSLINCISFIKPQNITIMITKETIKNKFVAHRYRRAGATYAGIKYIVASLALITFITIVLSLS